MIRVTDRNLPVFAPRVPSGAVVEQMCVMSGVRRRWGVFVLAEDPDGGQRVNRCVKGAAFKVLFDVCVVEGLVGDFGQPCVCLTVRLSVRARCFVV